MQHILILSQDEEYRKALISLLKDAGYTVYPSDTIKDTVDQFYSKKLDLIIVDVESWKEEGVTTYRDLRHELGTKDFSSIIIVPMDLMENVLWLKLLLMMKFNFMNILIRIFIIIIIVMN